MSTDRPLARSVDVMLLHETKMLEVTVTDDRHPAADVLGSVASPPMATTFEEFYEANWAMAYRLAVFMGAEDPDDVAQDAFARMHGRYARLDGSDGALRYLRAAVCNLSRSRWRRRAVAQRDWPLRPTTEPAGPEETYLAAVTGRELLDAVRGLSRRQHEVMVMRYWLDLDEREIAQTLGISTGSVKTHASRSIAILRQQMGTRS